MIFRTLLFVGFISVPASAVADCISEKAAANYVVDFINQDSETPDCLVDLTRAQWNLEMIKVWQSLTRVFEGEGTDEQLTGYEVTVCEAPYNAPDATEDEWNSGYETTLIVSCDGRVEKYIDSNDSELMLRASQKVPGTIW